MNDLPIENQDENLDNIIVLQDENGEDVNFEFLDIIEYKAEEYVVLLPLDENDNQVVILKIDGDDGENQSYVSVDSEETLNAVFAIFKNRFKDFFNFID